MKKIFTFLILLVIVSNAYSQTPNWLWAIQSSGGGPYQEGKGIAASATTGDIYFAARLSQTVTIAGQTATGNAINDGSIGRLKNDGTGVWYHADNYNTSGENYLYAFYKDNADNTYSTGQIQGDNHAYFNKYNSAGVKQLGIVLNTGSPVGYGIVADYAGNIYISGEYLSDITIGSTTLTYSGSGGIDNSNTYLAKYDPNGTFIWAVKVYGSGGDIAGRNLTVDPTGNVYMCGSYSGTATFGNITAPAVSGQGNFFIAKFDPTNGDALWLNTAPGAGFTQGYYKFWEYWYITCDSCANTYVTGHYTGTAQFGAQTLTGVGGDDIFVAKCSNSGKWLWAKSAGGAGNDAGFGIALDKNNDVYVDGYFNQTAQFDGQSLTSAGNGDVFVSKYANLTGDQQWVQQGGGSGDEIPEGIAVDNDGFVYIATNPKGSSSFGSTTLTYSSQNTIVIAKLDTVPTRNIIPELNTSYCPGSTITIPYTANGTYNSGNTFTAQLSDSSGSFSSPVLLGSNTSQTGGTMSITIPQNTVTGANYFIRIISSNPANSSYASCNTISIGGNLSLNVTNDATICSGTPLQLTVSGSGTILWSPGNTLSDSTIANPVATPVSNQTYIVTVHSGNCVSSDSVAVTVNSSVAISVTPKDTTICSGNKVQLLATGGSIFNWTSGSTLSDSTIANPVAAPLTSTTYTITGGACTIPAQVIVNVGNSAAGGVITAVRDTICEGTSGSLALSGNSSNTLQWQSSGVNTGGYTNINNPNSVDTTKFRTDPLTQSTWFRVLVGSGTCVAASDSLQLVVPPSLTASFTSVISGNTVSFNSDGSIGNISSYFWDFGDGTTSAEPNPSHTYTSDTLYNPCLTIYDGSNCSYTFCRGIALGIETVSVEGNWTIYPNPFDKELNIESMNNLRQVMAIEMYDMLGRQVTEEMPGDLTNSTLQLNTSQLARGMYYIMIKTTDANYVQKVVKQ